MNDRGSAQPAINRAPRVSALPLSQQGAGAPGRFEEIGCHAGLRRICRALATRRPATPAAAAAPMSASLSPISTA